MEWSTGKPIQPGRYKSRDHVRKSGSEERRETRPATDTDDQCGSEKLGDKNAGYPGKKGTGPAQGTRKKKEETPFIILTLKA